MTAINRIKIQKWLQLKAQNCVVYPIKTTIKGVEKSYTEDEEAEYLQLLGSEEGLDRWLDATDLKVFSDEFKVTIGVIMVRDGKLAGVPQHVSQQYPGKQGILILDLRAEHYKAVVNKEEAVDINNAEKCKGIFYELSKYVTKTAPKRSQSPPAKHRSCDSCVSVARYDELDRKINAESGF